MNRRRSIHESIESMDIVTKDDPSYSVSDEQRFSMINSVPPMTLSWHDVVVMPKKSTNSSPAKSSSPLLKKSEKVSDIETSTQSSPENQPKLVLNKAYGVARPGEVIAIVGPSGAGKTTLLNVLTQRNCGELDVTGSVKVNGLRVTRSFMKKVCAYVQQTDLFIGSLTVEEHLRFMANLKMGRTHTKKEQQQRVEQVINDLGLKNSANSIIGTRTRRGLSGGEKKRLAFASEILTSPPILICDEPTSGLDAFLAYQVICVLKNLAKKQGMTILLTIHQPSSQVFQLFDSIYIMVNGKVAFCGSQIEAENLWKDLKIGVPLNFNPCDHYLATLSSQKTSLDRRQILEICDSFEKSENGMKIWKEATGRLTSEVYSESSSDTWRRRYDNMQEKKFPSTFFQQLRTLTWRAGKTVLREPTLLQVQLTQSVVIALLTGLIYTNNTPINQQKIMSINGSLYQMVANMAFMFQFSVVHHFCLEIETFYRETGNGLYRVSAYFLAKNLAELPSYTICAIIFTSILYWMSGLIPIFETFLIYVLVGFLVQNIAISIGYLFSCVFGSVNLAVAIMPIFVVPMMAMGGFFINQDSLPSFFRPLKYLSYFGYGYEAVAIGQWKNVGNIDGCSSLNSTICLENGPAVLENLSFSENHLYFDLIIMIGMLLIFRFSAFCALLIRVKTRN